MIATVAQDRFSIVTIFDSGGPPPAWQRMFGWPSSGAAHLPIRSAEDRTIWAAKLDRVVRDADRAVLLVADGIGCAASAWWARLSPTDYVDRIAGALLFPSSEVADSGFAAPRTRLPFPSLIVRPGDAAAPAAETAEWGSRIVTRHRQPGRASGTAPWHNAQRLFQRLTRQIVEQDIARAQARFGGG